jgi:predicted DCC family thiol-disulfide oxidoreductase YuxK
MGGGFGEPDRIAARARSGKLAVLYDGACEMCRSVAGGILDYDNSGSLELFNLHDAEAREHFPELKLDDLLYELHVIDDEGHVYRGARAVNEILRRQIGLRGLFAYLWYLPGYAWLADRQYKAIAASRYRLGAGAKPNRPVNRNPAQEP